MTGRISTQVLSRHRRASNAVMAICIVAMVGVGVYIVGHGSAVTVPAVSSAGKAGTFWYHLDSSAISSSTIATEAPRRRYIVLNSWDNAYIAKFKAINPAIMVLAYKDLSSTRDYACHNGTDDASLPTGVGYCYANTQHPEWFLKSSGGSRLTYGSYAGHWQMDIGNQSYQQAWTTNVKNDLSSKGFDGAMLDNALFACDDYHSGVCPASYPTNTSFQSAYKSMLGVVTPGLNAAGLKTMANLNNARTHPGAWNGYLDRLNGGFDEFWLSFSSSNVLPEYGNPSQGWKAVVDEIAYAESAGKFVGVQPHFSAGDKATFRYAYASFLMANGGRGSFSEINSTDAYTSPPAWHAEYDWDLGAASGAYYAISTNVYRRDFACGMALVNANASGSPAVSIPLGRAMLNQDGTSVTSLSMGGLSGAVLRIAGCSPTTASPTPTASKTPTPTPAPSSPSPSAPPATGASPSASPAPTPARADVTPPFPPSNVRVILAAATQMAITWDAPEDASGIGGYRVFRDDYQRADQAGRSYLDAGLTANTVYTYSVEAYDSAGNASARATLTTSTQPAAGSQPVSGPGADNPLTITPGGITSPVSVAAGELVSASGQISLATSGSGLATILVDGGVASTNGQLDTTYLTNGTHTVTVKQGEAVATRVIQVNNELSAWQTARNTLFAPFHGNAGAVNTVLVVILGILLAASAWLGYRLIQRRRGRGHQDRAAPGPPAPPAASVAALTVTAATAAAAPAPPTVPAPPALPAHEEENRHV